MKTLAQLITNTQSLIEEIIQHPDYQKLLENDYTPDVTIGDAKTALINLAWEVEPPAATIELELGNDF
ncbi:hypothetical protein I8752_22615 [Nostocaceae cyanobacterium CENA369]|uniref:Uncharacterized protein n=1 Tax=Dendronalium phyllosphericum CENA369 TaxID=1725256 RepID=A0A8J7I4P9_9NOST|nr:hypothetical protein [Dendronalium phyllosphericum]MBH8575746.1 hypothetical protein [Dendronalium phyllosphericum CENA369]